MTVSYAQRFEDIFLLRALREIEKGFYIDLGAHDPILDSVTKLFYERQWSGINVEPAPECFIELCKDRVRDINLAIAIADKPGIVIFNEIFSDKNELTGLSTISDNIAERHICAGFKRRIRTVPTDTLTGICERYVNGPIHFLKIDIEGGEEAALRGMNFQRWRPWIVVIEATEPLTETPSHEAWESIILQNNYDFVFFDGLNRFYLSQERAELRMFLSFPVDNYINLEIYRGEERLKAEIQRLANMIESMKS